MTCAECDGVIWPHTKLKFVARFEYGDALPADQNHEGAFKVFGSNGVYATSGNANTQAPAIIVGRKGSYGKINWTQQKCFASDTTFFIDSSTTKHCLRWVYWLLQTLHLDEGTSEAAVPGLSRDFAYNKRVPIPSPAEQRAIAGYLDRETGRMDALVAAKERLLELLAEKRQALIARAVTRGLDSDVRLKPSGVEWLGDVPAHWEVRRLKHWVQVNKAVLPETTDPQYEFRYLEIGAVDAGVVIDAPKKIHFAAAPSRARRIVRNGDTIVSTVRTYLKAVWFAKETNNDLICSTGFAVLTPGHGTAPKFVGYLAESNSFTDRVTAESVGIAYPAITESRLSSFHVCVPPFTEQTAIADYLDRETSKLDALAAKAREIIDLLKERRAALISAAVTGKIDIGGCA